MRNICCSLRTCAELRARGNVANNIYNIYILLLHRIQPHRQHYAIVTVDCKSLISESGLSWGGKQRCQAVGSSGSGDCSQ